MCKGLNKYRCAKVRTFVYVRLSEPLISQISASTAEQHQKF